MKRSDLWLTLLASIGVGAATFYTMSKNNTSLSQTVKNIAPMLSNMNSQSSNDTQQLGSLGQHGMS